MGLSKIKIILLVMLLVSCGSKKKTVQRSKEQSIEIVNKDVQRSKINDITTNTIIEKNDLKTTVRPIDESKPFKYNGNHFQNAEIIIEKSDKKEQVSVVDKSTLDHRDLSTKRDKKNTSSVNKNVDIDRSWGLFDWLWLFMAILIVAIGVRLYMKKINPLKGLKNIIGIK